MLFYYIYLVVLSNRVEKRYRSKCMVPLSLRNTQGYLAHKPDDGVYSTYIFYSSMRVNEYILGPQVLTLSIDYHVYPFIFLLQRIVSHHLARIIFCLCQALRSYTHVCYFFRVQSRF